MRFIRNLVALLAVAGLAIAAPALAHPKLVSADPASGASAAAVSHITLSFSEPLIAQLSGIEVVMTGMASMPGMPGMAHRVSGVRVSLGPDGKTLVATLPRTLPSGSYEADWHAVSTDTHRVTGKLAFTVK
jgi:methionine-rich copper-binding protein CopC